MKRVKIQIPTAAWYIVQVMEDNQSEWWDLSAPCPVGNHDSLIDQIGFMNEQKDLNPENRYRLIIRTESELSEAE